MMQTPHRTSLPHSLDLCNACERLTWMLQNCIVPIARTLRFGLRAVSSWHVASYSIRRTLGGELTVFDSRPGNETYRQILSCGRPPTATHANGARREQRRHWHVNASTVAVALLRAPCTIGAIRDYDNDGVSVRFPTLCNSRHLFSRFLSWKKWLTTHLAAAVHYTHLTCRHRLHVIGIPLPYLVCMHAFYGRVLQRWFLWAWNLHLNY